MATKLTRFLNLETPPAKPGDQPDFAAERAAQLQSGIDVAQAPADEQPFLRCPWCEADNSKYAGKCINCQARIDTEQVAEWNRNFWQERRKQRSSEARPLSPAAELAPEQQRALGEAIAQQVAQTERRKLGWDGPDTTPLGMRLLGQIPDANKRFAAAMGLVGLFFASGLVAFVAKHHPVLQTGAIVVAVALLVLFTPNRHRRNRWWDWD